jgi:thiopurine S-methyltransferase
MEPSFWHDRWQTNNISGFNLPSPNPALMRHWPVLGIPAGARVFVPLCGKSVDLPWLASQGYRVLGAELSPLAVGQFFEELGVTPSVREAGPLKAYEAKGITIFAGDLFELTPALLGPIDAIYDRASMVALPPAMRERYVAQLLALGGGVPQLLITYTYDTRVMDGPPFSVPSAEIEKHYSGRYKVEQLSSEAATLRGGVAATEEVRALRRR